MYRLLISADGSTAPLGKDSNRTKSAIGICVEVSEFKNNMWYGPELLDRIGKKIKCKTNNEAEFSAILLGLRKTYDLIKKKIFEIHSVEFISDSKLAINSINRESQLSAGNLLKIRSRIDKMVNGLKNLGIEIKFKWARRNSTSGLKEANAMAQSFNGLRVR